MNKLPKIRENLLVQELANEVLIYDQSTNNSYCLNETAKTVFNACDGAKTVADVGLPEDIIYFALDELKRNDLLASEYVSPYAGLTRREVVRKIGLATMIALPVISSLIAPTAANAASGPTACAQRGGTCIPANQNICANRANQTVAFYYYNTSAAGPCRGSDTGFSNPSFPCGNSSPTTTFDVCRVG